MQQTDFQEMIELINDADMVLIGLGEEFDDAGAFRDNREYEIGKKLLADAQKSSLIPAWQTLFRVNDDKISSGLNALAKLLENKNYFVVSVSTNPVISQVSWREGRLVMPCGTELYKQCTSSCKEHLCMLSTEEQNGLYNQLMEWKQMLATEETEAPEGLGLCPICNAKVDLNNIYSEQYDEEGYLKEWQLYTKWLQGTVNRKLVVLELGVRMKFPSVIRFPFEKIAYFNQKARFYRINKNLYHLTEELAGKGVGIADNAIDWLQNLC